MRHVCLTAAVMAYEYSRKMRTFATCCHYLLYLFCYLLLYLSSNCFTID